MDILWIVIIFLLLFFVLGVTAPFGGNALYIILILCVVLVIYQLMKRA